MNFCRIALLILVILLSACAQPLPAARQSYVGHWQGPGVNMLIQADGSFTYKRVTGSSTTSINAPIQKFEGDDFFVGVGPIGTRFDVTKPPTEMEGEWRMTVDGVELRRVDAPADNGKLISS